MDEVTRKSKKLRKWYYYHYYGDPGYPIQPTGQFRDNIRLLLQNFGDLDYEVKGDPIWITLLVHERRKVLVPLCVIEENVKDSDKPYCNHCRCAGWSHHFVCKRRYHFIIPAVEMWSSKLDEGVLEMQTHLLHGLIHCNGFGHLICINGIEGGSKNLPGKEIMDLWDRICTNLRACKISVKDETKKRGMEFRLLHGIAYGQPWFSNWNYIFWNGTFGVTELLYKSALKMMSSMTLGQIAKDFEVDKKKEDDSSSSKDFKSDKKKEDDSSSKDFESDKKKEDDSSSDDNTNKEIREIIQYYSNVNERRLSTLGDLFRFTLTENVLSRFPSELSRTTFHNKYVGNDISNRNKEKVTTTRWSEEKLKRTETAIFKILKEKVNLKKDGTCVMSTEDVREATRKYIRSKTLIDFVISRMYNVIFEDIIIRKTSEFSFHTFDGGWSVDFELGSSEVLVHAPHDEHGRDKYSDLHRLCAALPLKYPEPGKHILNSKILVKEYQFLDKRNGIFCQLSAMSPVINLDVYPILEYVDVKKHDTVANLKLEFQIGLRDQYFTMEHLERIEIQDKIDLTDDDCVLDKINSGTKLRFSGYVPKLDEDLAHEGGPGKWEIRCRCGARVDDGEPMVECYSCFEFEHGFCNRCDKDIKVFLCIPCELEKGLLRFDIPVPP